MEYPENVTIGFTKAFPEETWDNTDFGECPFYYNMNYDGVAQAMTTLYAIFIQGGWDAIADGGVEVTNVHYRLWFVVYYLLCGTVMAEILCGVIIDSMYAVREEMMKNGMDSLETICHGRLSSTRGPSGNFYSDTWELLDIPLNGPIRSDAAICDLLSDENAHPAKHHMLRSDISELRQEIQFQSDLAAGGDQAEAAYGQIMHRYKIYVGPAHDGSASPRSSASPKRSGLKPETREPEGGVLEAFDLPTMGSSGLTVEQQLAAVDTALQNRASEPTTISSSNQPRYAMPASPASNQAEDPILDNAMERRRRRQENSLPEPIVPALDLGRQDKMIMGPEQPSDPGTAVSRSTATAERRVRARDVLSGGSNSGDPGAGQQSTRAKDGVRTKRAARAAESAAARSQHAEKGADEEPVARNVSRRAKMQQYIQGKLNQKGLAQGVREV